MQELSPQPSSMVRSKLYRTMSIFLNSFVHSNNIGGNSYPDGRRQEAELSIFAGAESKQRRTHRQVQLPTRVRAQPSPCTGGSSNTKMFSTISAPSSGEKGYENLLLVEIQIPSVRKSSVSFVLQCSSVVYSSPNIIILS